MSPSVSPRARHRRRRRSAVGLSLILVAGLLPVTALAPAAAASTSLVINEIDYDQPGTDAAEFIEIKNVGTASVNLADVSVELINGNAGGAVLYQTINPSGTLAPGAYYVICANAATTPNCNLDVAPDTNLIQNGAPDAVGLRWLGTLIDAVSYEGDTGAPYTEGSGTGLEDNPAEADMGISRCPDGTDTDQNNVDFAFRPITPGTANACVVLPALVINEIDYDQPGTDTAEFIELKNVGTASVSLAGVTVELINGNAGGAVSYGTIGLSGTLAAGGYYVICANAAFTLNCNLDVTPDTNLIQNGAPDAVGLRWGTTLIDTVSYEGDTGAPYTEGSGTGLEDDPASADFGISRCPDGTDTDRNNIDFQFRPITPGAANSCPLPALVINEIDYDQPGTDAAEFVEIKNVGVAVVDLSAYTLEFINGASGGAAVYDTIALPAVSLAAGDYFVVCANAATVANCDLDDDPDTNFIQNGAPDAVALKLGTAIVDTVSYEGDTGAPYTEGSGTGLEDDPASADFGISRCPDGADTNQNNVDFAFRPITPGAANDCPGVDAAPAVSSTTPANGATGVAVSSNISITFDEPVNVSGAWFSIVCGTTGSHAATVSGGPTTFTLDPTVDFGSSESCTVTVFAAQVSDQDTNDPPDNMAADFSWSFSTLDVCTLSYTPIYAIQGSGSSAAITGNVTTQGVVVGDFEGTAAASGFYLQDLTGDSDPATSDGIFVFTGSSDLVNAGDVVRVSGFARERFNQTALNGSNSNSAAVPAANIVNCGTGSVAPTDVMLPFASATDPERFEGMLVRFPQPLVISEYFNYDRFGEMVLALPLPGETRAFTGTAVDAPGTAANARTLANSLRRITLDDAQSGQNPSVNRHPNGDPFSLSNRFRGGDTVANTVGVLGFDFSLYRIFPTGPADYTAVNTRPASPDDVGGTLRVAGFNTLNYFLTADYPSSNPLDNKCGPALTLECRGWDFDQPDELNRQRAKLLAAIEGLDADIVGLNELENTTGVEPMADIVAGLNDTFGPGTYAYIDTGTIGTDAIKVGLIYKPAAVTPVGAYKILDSSVDTRFNDALNRPVLAQTFDDNATGGRFTVAVNHLKSKGSNCNAVGDPDVGDGQGNCNLTRKAAAEAMVDWLEKDPTGSGDKDFLILGDLNSYAMEDPITAIKKGPDDTAGTADDYVNLIAQFQGAFAYSFVFDGQAGYLDHALASATLAGQVTGATEWHINADEPDILDYDTSFKPPSQDALYEPNAYRSSDHDPVVIGLNLTKRNLTGFLPPVMNRPAANTAKAGSVVALNFSLGGFQGFDILAETPQVYVCSTSGWPLGSSTNLVTAGSSMLQYEALTDEYTIAWKTSKGWKNSCRTVEIVFDDGSYRLADISFTK